MAGFSNAVEAAILDCYFNQTNITAPTAIYLALFSVAPDDAGAGGTELSGNGYARVDVTTKFSAASSGAVTNDQAIDFPTASGAWSAAVAWGLYTASSGGTYIFGDTCSLGALSANQFHRIPVGDLDVTLD
jgi:hypothetical protein